MTRVAALGALFACALVAGCRGGGPGAGAALSVEEARGALLKMLPGSGSALLKASGDHLRTAEPVRESAEKISFGRWKVDLRSKSFLVVAFAETGNDRAPGVVSEHHQGRFEHGGDGWVAALDLAAGYRMIDAWGTFDGEFKHRHSIQRRGDAEPILYYTDFRMIQTIVAHRLGRILVTDDCATQACDVKVVELPGAEAHRVDGPALAMYSRNANPGSELTVVARGKAFSPDDGQVLLETGLYYVMTGNPRPGESIAEEDVRLRQRYRKWCYAVDAKTGEVVREFRTDRPPEEWWRAAE